MTLGSGFDHGSNQESCHSAKCFPWLFGVSARARGLSHRPGIEECKLISKAKTLRAGLLAAGNREDLLKHSPAHTLKAHAGRDDRACVYIHQIMPTPGQIAPGCHLDDARIKLNRWRYDYNNVRPHSALNGNPPTTARRALELPDGSTPDALAKPKPMEYQTQGLSC